MKNINEPVEELSEPLINSFYTNDSMLGKF